MFSAGLRERLAALIAAQNGRFAKSQSIGSEAAVGWGL
jgi:hypothetical protein